MLDLFRFHRDILQLNKVSLLVLDECHHSGTGDHCYSQFMDEVYWSDQKENRPRVLGLTASPCVNFLDEDDLKIKVGKPS